jgi:hypothetical protein
MRLLPALHAPAISLLLKSDEVSSPFHASMQALAFTTGFACSPSESSAASSSFASRPDEPCGHGPHAP